MDGDPAERSILGRQRRSRKEAFRAMSTTQTTPVTTAASLGQCCRREVFAALLALVSHPLAASAAELLAARATIRADDAKRHVSALADDAFEGREGGSRGGRAAGSYIIDQLTRLGLEPAGDGGGFYQSFGGMRNILALVRGSDPAVAGELVVIGAHYDHVGYGNSANSYGPFGFVHNGADDNASGVAGLLEIAEAIQHLPAKPRRPILIAFWDGEEKGLLGSYHFVRVRPAAVAGMKVVFSVNLDMIGRLRGERLEVYGARTAMGLRSAVVAANNRAGGEALELAFDWAIEDDSDHYPFIAAGIPTVMFHTGLHDQYHRPSDDVHLVNFPGIEPVARLALEFVTAVADDPGPARLFRPSARQESDATRRTLEAVATGVTTNGSTTTQAGDTARSRPRWGIGTREDAAEPTAPVVVRVTTESPAARAGMMIGDRVIAVDGRPLANQADMVERLARSADRVLLDIDRKGRIVRLEMTSASQ
jgi:hypothetical protein